MSHRRRRRHHHHTTTVTTAITTAIITVINTVIITVIVITTVIITVIVTVVVTVITSVITVIAALNPPSHQVQAALRVQQSMGQQLGRLILEGRASGFRTRLFVVFTKQSRNDAWMATAFYSLHAADEFIRQSQVHAVDLFFGDAEALRLLLVMNWPVAQIIELLPSDVDILECVGPNGCEVAVLREKFSRVEGGDGCRFMSWISCANRRFRNDSRVGSFCIDDVLANAIMHWGEPVEVREE